MAEEHKEVLISGRHSFPQLARGRRSDGPQDRRSPCGEFSELPGNLDAPRERTGRPGGERILLGVAVLSVPRAFVYETTRPARNWPR